jgi:hypothetical protein
MLGAHQCGLDLHGHPGLRRVIGVHGVAVRQGPSTDVRDDVTRHMAVVQPLGQGLARAASSVSGHLGGRHARESAAHSQLVGVGEVGVGVCIELLAKRGRGGGQEVLAGGWACNEEVVGQLAA